ncbi:hypothetical protein ABAC460_10675 [Asticcacaulis sp. AC460]|uniref:tail fiber protein n=1 Tax=Asticcacaulis sp. AC460 TaxID=1282360 RepID=UPI0003C3DD26|nr:tail fiber protein [Asticcacaulis sp. AC460]ESQ90206.1 hypothetical protein ABAC460_10675 [Asticcacaulis sp. AC460]
MKPLYLSVPESLSAFGSRHSDFGLSPASSATVALGIASTTSLSAVSATTASLAEGRTDTVSTAAFTVTNALTFATAIPDAGPIAAPYIISNWQPYLTINFLVPLEGIYPPQNGLNGAPEEGVNNSAYMGGIRMFAGNFAPQGDALAAGQLLSIAQNTALFSLFGTTYGGDGITTFALPDLGGRTTVGIGTGAGLTPRTLGQVFGAETLNIASANLPYSAGGTAASLDNYNPSLGTRYLIQIQGIFPSQDGLADDGLSDGGLIGNNMDMMGLVVQFAGSYVPRGYLACEGQLLSISQNIALFSLLGTTYGGNGTTTFALPDLRGRTVVGVSASHSLGQAFGSDREYIDQNELPADMAGSGNPVTNNGPSLALHYMIATQGIFPSRNSLTEGDPEEQYIGEIAITAINYAPRGWMFCEGQLLSIAQNTALFSLLGTTYGGNGTTNFALPDFRGRTAVGTDTGFSLGQQAGSESYTLSSTYMPALDLNGNQYQNTLIGAGQNDTIHAYGGNDSLVGNNGDDVLDGGAVTDTMSGGAGNDTYYVDSEIDSIIEPSGQGTDLVYASVTYSLAGTFVEALTLTGSANLNGTGNGQANTVTGNTGNNSLDGGAGNDTMYGGLGDDTFIVSVAGDVVYENSGEGTDTVEASVTYTLGYNLENIVLTGSANINATGNALDNILYGNTGTNILTGGLGNDTYFVQNTTDNVVEASNEGTDLINSFVTYSLAGRQVENLTLIGGDPVNGTGNSLANTLTGNAANNTLDGGTGHDRLDGGAGADTMIGGSGNDTFVVDNAGDSITENAGGGAELIEASITWTLGANSENLTLTGAAAINGTGNDGNNILTGNAGVNVLAGGLGDDTFYVQTVGDNVVEAGGSGNDVIFSTVTYSLNQRYAETLNLTGGDNVNATGNSLTNTLSGNTGNNTLNGKGGADNLTGGLGADIFLFEAGSGVDVITDFTAAQDDAINIHAYTNGATNTGIVTQNGGNVLIDLGGGNTITVNNALQTEVLAHIVW